MERTEVLRIVRETLQSLSLAGSSIPAPPPILKETDALQSLGISLDSAVVFSLEFRARLGLPINFQFMLSQQAAAAAVSQSINFYTTLGHLVDHVTSSLSYHAQTSRP